MNEETIEIGGIHFNNREINKYWIDAESTQEKAIKNHYQENHYLGGFFAVLFASLISQYLSRKNSKLTQKKYLHIQTHQNTAYCFSESEIDINAALFKLKNNPHLNTQGK
ncbi:hypothetical protein HQN60_02110 [Deefgea piscis]|uniref:Uncharacterized protein n=1 Tax=Deefgea piscis TaxID=2739061 RepID=A0A6M8SRX9_9NEIS|nr:hypothetical protein [Deefgea piscis]QKJ65629.1 hypothetical protein HQN60_02110 [Deefgea piscis]